MLFEKSAKNQSEFPHSQDISLAVFLVLAAFIVPTYFSMPLYGQINLYFGSFFTFIAILTLPRRLSVLVLIANVYAMHLLISSTLMAMILAAEYACIVYLIRKHVNPLISVSLFWAIFGFPAIISIFILLAGDSIINALFTSLTIALNGFVCGVFALMVYRLIPPNSRFKRTNPPPRKYAVVVLELCIIVVLLPTILAALFFTWYSTNDTEKKVGEELRVYAIQLQNNISQRLSHNLNTVSSVANTIDSLDKIDKFVDMLTAISNSNQDFESMLITNKEGKVLVAAPGNYNDYIQQNDFYIDSRKYFQETIKTKSEVVSGIVKSFGDKNSAIIATTAPILRQNEILGIVQGAIWLKDLIDNKTLESIEENDIQIIITDQNGSIIYSSQSLNFENESSFSSNESVHPFVRLSPVTNINGLPYMYDVKVNQYNWRVYTVVSPEKLVQGILDYFSVSIFILLMSFSLVVVFSRRLSNNITKPLVNLESFVAGKIEEEVLLNESKVSQEMVNVSKNLVESYQLSMAFNQKLKEQVEQQTARLTTLNEQLYLNSRIDSLTNLLNRGAFDNDAMEAQRRCLEDGTCFAIIIIDIDHFKKINDKYGHTAGDKCICHVASRLSQVFDDSHLIARYGGEEYVVMIKGIEYQECVNYCELTRSLIEKDRVDYEDHQINFTISLGLAFFQNNKNNAFEKTITLADEMLYKSKSNGRNQLNTVKY